MTPAVTASVESAAPVCLSHEVRALYHRRALLGRLRSEIAECSSPALQLMTCSAIKRRGAPYHAYHVQLDMCL